MHARGRVRALLDERDTLAVLRDTVAHDEAARAAPGGWTARTPGCATWLAFELEVERLDAIDKLSQNVAPHPRERVVAGLLAQGHEDAATAVLAASAGRAAGEGA